jgi:DNA-binding GntR family transcriptional regulator
MTNARSTAADRIRTTLADEIAVGVLHPGVALDEAGLAERFGVSRTPIREALRQLQAIGFVEARPHQTALVRRFTAQRLTEMFRVMADLEALCARYAAGNARSARAEISAAHIACRDAAAAGDYDAYAARNVVFHELIYALSSNGFLAEIARSVRQQVAPFRRAQFGTQGRLLQSVAEHQAVVEAILAGDGEAAAQAMARHIESVRASVGEIAPALREPSAQEAGSKLAR